MRLGSLPLTLLVALLLRLSPEATAIPLPGSLPGAPGQTPIPETLVTLSLEVETGGRNPGDPIRGAAV
ncbi:MAG TPA: hypothetical protein VM557_10550, partial [Thermoanaerobaculia bacterium]|nr:hypothetical protein [Thermoanaerobaculia bacterium]